MKIRYTEKPFEDDIIINGKKIENCDSTLVGELFAILHKNDKYVSYRLTIENVLLELLEEVEEHHHEDDGVTYHTYEGEI